MTMQDGSYYGNYTSIHPAPRVRIRFLSVFIALAVFGGFFWLAWYAYKAGTSTTAPTEVPLVTADDEPFRVKPEDPGGMVIPHQDKTVYEAIARQPNDGKPKQEKLLPLAEEPVKADSLTSEEQLRASRQQIMEEVRQGERKVEVLTNVPHPAPEPEMVLNTVPEESAIPKEVLEKAAEPVKEAPVISPKVEPVKAKEPVTAVAKASASGQRVQLGAFKTKKEADETWLKIRRQHTEVVGSYGYDVEKADLGAKGVFYRLQIVGLKDTTEAQNMCKKLSARQQGCFVVKK